MLVVAVPEAAGPWLTHDRDSSEYRVPVPAQLIGAPAALLEIGGLRLLTDPAFDAPGTINTATTWTGPAGRCAAFAGDERLRVIAAGERITL